MFASRVLKLSRVTVALLLLLGGISGCSAGRLAFLDQSWGQSSEDIFREMMVHPAPSAESASPPMGLDPLSAEAVLENYKNGLARSSSEGPPTFILAPVGN